MYNSHLFQDVPIYLFQAQYVMGIEIYKQHGFYFTCTCVLMLLGFWQWI